MTARFLALTVLLGAGSACYGQAKSADRLRIIIETDAGGDPDDEQSLVRFLLYANEFDIEGIICTRPKTRPGENVNVERTGLGIVQRLLKAYGECHANLIKHDRRFSLQWTQCCEAVGVVIGEILGLFKLWGERVTELHSRARAYLNGLRIVSEPGASA